MRKLRVLFVLLHPAVIASLLRLMFNLALLKDPNVAIGANAPLVEAVSEMCEVFLSGSIDIGAKAVFARSPSNLAKLCTRL